MTVPTFAAIDFETADHRPDSACAVGVVRVEAGRPVAVEARLIRPPRREFVFTYLHRLTWDDVASAPRFTTVWRELSPLLDGVEFLAAHNAGFERSVLRACLPAPVAARRPLLCTVRVARAAWNLRPANLPAVARFLDVELAHHEAASDAKACAEIVLAAHRTRPDVFARLRSDLRA